MKLLTKTLVYFISTSLVVFLLGGIIFYEILKMNFYEQIDRGVMTEKAIVEEEIRHNQDIPDFSSRFGHEIEVIIYRHPVKPVFVLKDTAIFDTTSMENQFYRYLRVDDNTRTRGYSISILQPSTARHALFRSVIDMMLIMFLVIMLFSIIINYIVSRRLWLPFYDTIREINNYDITAKSLMVFHDTNIKEFEQLNEVLDTMSKKIREDFYSLKEFTENASHEIQTPLAIIRSKLELLIQSENLSPTQSEIIQTINGAASRLSKLNAGLLLITKIDNHQYAELQPVDLHLLLNRVLEGSDEFIKHRELQVEFLVHAQPVFRLNPVLAELLIHNLINNAIKHNFQHGFIKIDLDSLFLTISNSGDPLEDDPEKLFNRFVKTKKGSDSLGLGLAIVKKVCNFHNIFISYSNEKKVHRIILNFTEVDTKLQN